MAARAVTAAIYENPPKVFTDSDGAPAGIFVEILREIALREDWRLNLVRCDWNDCLDRIDAGEIDLLPDMANALNLALEREQFELHYQPQFALDDDRIIGAEALLRWRHPELGAVAPSEFIPIAESNGMILRIGEWVIRQAVAQASHWLDRGLPELSIAISPSSAT